MLRNEVKSICEHQQDYIRHIRRRKKWSDEKTSKDDLINT